MSRFVVVPEELGAASVSLRSARGEMAGRAGSGGVGAGTGTGAFEAALSELAGVLDGLVAQMDAAVSQAGENAAAAARVYAEADEAAMPGGEV